MARRPLLTACLLACLRLSACTAAPQADDGDTRADAAPDDAQAPDAAPPTAPLAIAGDTDRDGQVTPDDLEDRATWRWQGRGAFALANLDDDDGDGDPDAEDATLDGAGDRDDLAPLHVWLSPATLAGATTVEVRVDGADARLFGDDPTGATTLTFAPAAELSLAVEARRFAGPDWDGRITVRAVARDAAGAIVAEDAATLRVAPWIMLPSTAATERIYVATGPYANAAFLADLEAAADELGVPLHPPHPAATWQEMWMQDTMEIGYTQLPGRAPMHVVLRANRGADGFPRTLLGPGVGFLVVGADRALGGGDAWADWYGNLEVSAPVPGWPLGRIYYGRNTASGQTLHPEVVAFLEAQAVQAPFWVDTSWLTIKHVDEIFNVVRGSDGAARVILASPRAAGTLYPVDYGPYNKSIQAKLDTIVNGGTYTIAGQAVSHPGVKALLGLTDADIVELPVLYTGGHNDWSSPVNALFVDGTLLAGATDVPADVRAMITGRLGAIGVKVRWLRDDVYQHNLGNVHCATNATRTPVVPDFWAHLPAMD